MPIFCNRARLCYTRRMEKNALIAGKDAPDILEFADALIQTGFRVAVTGNAGDMEGTQAALIKWNKASAISARSLVIQAETALKTTANTIFYFDAALFSLLYPSMTAAVCSKVLDELTAGFQYLAIETLNRIQQHKKSARLVFIVRNCLLPKDAVFSSLKDDAAGTASPPVAAAQAAFTAFAENIAALIAQNGTAHVLLVSVEHQNAAMSTDTSLALWLSEYLNALDSAKTRQNAKTSCTWIKAGAKMPGTFSLFRL